MTVENAVKLNDKINDILSKAIARDCKFKTSLSGLFSVQFGGNAIIFDMSFYPLYLKYTGEMDELFGYLNKLMGAMHENEEDVKSLIEACRFRIDKGCEEKCDRIHVDIVH